MHPFYKYKHIIWDWNGTLLDDLAASIHAMNSVLRRRNMQAVTEDTYRYIFDFPVIRYYERLGFDFSIEPFETISREYINTYDGICSGCKLHDGADKLLRSIEKAGITQVILSASFQSYLEYIVSYFNIAHYFVQLIGLDHIHATSKVENGKNWVSSLPCKPTDILLIGDTVHDYEVSKAIGCDCILVACGHQNKEKLQGCGVPVYDTLSELAAFTGLPMPA